MLRDLNYKQLRRFLNTHDLHCCVEARRESYIPVRDIFSAHKDLSYPIIKHKININPNYIWWNCGRMYPEISPDSFILNRRSKLYTIPLDSIQLARRMEGSLWLITDEKFTIENDKPTNPSGEYRRIYILF